MLPLDQWLKEKRARDVMTRTVRTLPLHAPVDDATKLFQKEHISGAPVLDDRGTCVGVISAADVINFDVQLCQDCNVSVYKPQPDELVGRRMSRSVVCAHEETPLTEILADLVDAKVHRVVVVDDDQHVVGIISTMDIVAALHAEMGMMVGP